MMSSSTPDVALPADPAAFARFARTADAVGATTKRLEKARLLGAHFETLGDEDLARAARYFAGYTFSLRDQRTTNVGGAALLAAVLAAFGADETRLRERLVALGDIGDVAGEAFAAAAATPDRTSVLTLADIAAFLEDLAATQGTKRKVEKVTALLGRTATPPEAKYLVKLLNGDLRIGLKEGAVEDALARLAGVPVAAVQQANMLTGDIGETALLTRHGRLDSAMMRLFHPLKFMLATAAADLSDVARQMPPSGFIVEDKFDGIRAQAHVAPVMPDEENVPLHGVAHDGVRVALFSRTLDEVTGSFADLVGPLAGLVNPLSPLPPSLQGKGELAAQGSSLGTGSLNPSGEADQQIGPNSPFPRRGGGRGERGSLLLDGEIVPIGAPGNDGGGDTPILPFQELQKRLGRKTLPAELLQNVPVAFVAYDVLYADGRVLLNAPFAERRAILESLTFNGYRVRRAASVRHDDVSGLDAEFDASRARGNEGLMVKDPASIYKPGRRGRDWLKIKRALATLDVVVTAAQVGEGRRSRFLSDYTFAVRASETDATLLNVGKAYSGLTDVEVQELSDWFKAHTLQEFAHGKVRTVEPQIVFEVTFDRVQPSQRHKSGFALRFPRILRVRADKPAGEIDTLETVRRLAHAGAAAQSASGYNPDQPGQAIQPEAEKEN